MGHITQHEQRRFCEELASTVAGRPSNRFRNSVICNARGPRCSLLQCSGSPEHLCHLSGVLGAQVAESIKRRRELGVKHVLTSPRIKPRVRPRCQSSTFDAVTNEHRLCRGNPDYHAATDRTMNPRTELEPRIMDRAFTRASRVLHAPIPQPRSTSRLSKCGLARESKCIAEVAITA